MGLLPDYSADKQTGSVMGVRCQENRPVPFMGRPVAIKAFRLVMPSFASVAKVLTPSTELIDVEDEILAVGEYKIRAIDNLVPKVVKINGRRYEIDEIPAFGKIEYRGALWRLLDVMCRLVVVDKYISCCSYDNSVGQIDLAHKVTQQLAVIRTAHDQMKLFTLINNVATPHLFGNLPILSLHCQ